MVAKQGGCIARRLTNGIGVILQSKKRFVFEPATHVTRVGFVRELARIMQRFELRAACGAVFG